MTEANPELDAIPLPALLRWSRNVYGLAIRQALEKAGYDDVPRNGIYVLVALNRAPVPMSRIVRELGATKQAAGQLVDTLVLRGYLRREVDPKDRRRLTVTLSDQGRAAAEIAGDVVRDIQQALEARVGEKALAVTRRTLAALGEISHQFIENGEQ